MSQFVDLIKSKRIGLALSGGAVRGLAHIGVLKALNERGIRPTFISGTSVGSIIGAALAAGIDWPEIADMARTVFWPKLLHGKTLEQYCAENLPQTFADLKYPFAAVATEVPSNQPVTIRSGSLSSAISASCAVRLLRRAVKRDGKRLKDGGFSCVLPTQACRELGAEIVIASDVWEWSSLMRSIGNSPHNRRWTSRAYPTHYRSALAHADLHIHPHIPIAGCLPNAKSVDLMNRVGEIATHRALDAFAQRIAA